MIRQRAIPVIVARASGSPDIGLNLYNTTAVEWCFIHSENVFVTSRILAQSYLHTFDILAGANDAHLPCTWKFAQCYKAVNIIKENMQI